MNSPVRVWQIPLPPQIARVTMAAKSDLAKFVERKILHFTSTIEKANRFGTILQLLQVNIHGAKRCHAHSLSAKRVLIQRQDFVVRK